MMMINKSAVPVLVAGAALVLTLAGCKGSTTASTAPASTSVGVFGSATVSTTPGAAGSSTGATGTTGPANPGTPGNPGSPSTSTGPVTGSTVPPAAIAGLARIDVPRNQINASGVTGNPPTDVQTAGGKYVLFTAEQSGCQQVSGQVTGESGSQVDITVIVTNTEKPGHMCPMIVRNVQVIVQLSAPLNNRTVMFHTLNRHA
jgi:hypothetical protein